MSRTCNTLFSTAKTYSGRTTHLDVTGDVLWRLKRYHHLTLLEVHALTANVGGQQQVELACAETAHHCCLRLHNTEKAKVFTDGQAQQGLSLPALQQFGRDSQLGQQMTTTQVGRLPTDCTGHIVKAYIRFLAKLWKEWQQSHEVGVLLHPNTISWRVCTTKHSWATLCIALLHRMLNL
jgi:hypothetical protein